MSLELIQGLLKSTMGLDAPSVGKTSLECALRARMSACGLGDADAYWQRLSTSTIELQELIEQVIVPETWFFRDREAFTALIRAIQQGWLQSQPERVLRLLSIPCASGEEPYSIAMALLDAGIPPHRFQVEGVDISLRVIAQAQRGEYGRNSFRTDSLAFRERYFSARGPLHVLKESVRQQVRFIQSNLFAWDSTAMAHSYDAVFCRNLLIYFDRPNQERALRVLENLLRPDGLLFVGPSEAALLLDAGFVSARMPMAFAFRSKESRSGAARGRLAPRRAGPSQHAHRGKRAVATAAAQPAVVAPARTPVAATAAPSPAPPPSALEEAQRLADAGELQLAMKSCERHIRAEPTSATAFYLMGVLSDAAGNVERASEHYRKALYLDPAHQEAMVHLAVVLSRRGDEKGARRLFERAQRAAGVAP